MLFASSQIMGTFKGFTEKGMEFNAEIVAPYDASMLDRPQLGQFVLIELATEEEAALGRITRLVPTGILVSPQGEDYFNTLQQRGHSIPEDLMVHRLKYRVQLKLLGAVRIENNNIIYVPSMRRLPHLGAKVAYPSESVLRRICQLSGGKTELGDYVLGEFVYCGAGKTHKDPAFRSLDPKLPVTFNVRNLVSRRTVVFARAGYGKSNLIKYLISELYKEEPMTKAGLKVGTLIFDADGEYFWPDTVDGRPGLCDVPHLKDKIIVYTSRKPPNSYYGSWKVGGIKLDIRQLKPRDVLGIALPSEKQENQNVLKLKGLNEIEWARMVDLIYKSGLKAPDNEIAGILGYDSSGASNIAEVAAARSNMYNVVRTLHDPNSKLLEGIKKGLKEGMIVVVDISLLSSAVGKMLTGLILGDIFSHNQENFTGGNPIIPTIAIIEEAQSVLGKYLDESSPFVEWVKEGRKYDLGAILITQQPGSIAPEILSQADNWFSFHLLSEGDAGTLGKYNSHFSDDILAHLVAEPIRGNCYMWSAPNQPFVLPVRVRDFEELYRAYVKPDASEGGIITKAGILAEELDADFKKMKDELKERLDNPQRYNIKYVKAEKLKGKKGIYKGQLFFIIKEIKDKFPGNAYAFVPEDRLMELLLNGLYGEGNVLFKRATVEGMEKEYFWIPA
ncbi:hypothetical protein E308F_24720 [Moorella sp. E308F]|uniref:ATP-binding protein n=1 Tax=Moorella sp. E308F TaxID=2572682 RepID=UPI0010FFB73A|nr:ATP-binding protein [Moorella sp. E308F]GEA16228.1 hypothetical protein E308F_24720 [Moorella sp. E308F]